jgi:hypothetical protein
VPMRARAISPAITPPLHRSEPLASSRYSSS